MRLAPFSICLIAAALLWPRPAAGERVARVIDGDTFQLEDGQKVRYAGINAPEEGELYFRDATQANNRLVGGKDVRLEFGRRREEKHGRLLAYVFVEKSFVQAELVKQGWAIVTRIQPLPRHRKVLEESQDEARAAGRGIWAKGDHRGKVAVVEVHPREAGKQNPNDAYVVFKNRGTTPLDLTGWAISDEANQSYLVPRFTLGPGKTFTLYTGSGKNTSDSLFWGRRKTVWNKGGDTVFVRDATGHLVVSYSY